MKKLIAALLGFALVTAPVTPAIAGWKLMEQGESVKVAKGSLYVTPGEDWNRWSVRPIKTSEIWTLDGTSLNELYFVSNLPSGKTLFRDANKKERPLPKFSSSMDLTEIPEFVESSTRLALNTSVFNMTSVEPAQLAGHPAVRFTYDYAVEGSPLKRKGMGIGAIVGGQLQLVTFVAPETYFFERDLPKVEQIIASATM
ncbi:hypothetical protein [Qipengyuania flava]|uniref:hypothetical protein n=1 Tax=Qipengyuania flava TaxID=192812 RepID=UPI001C627CDF|nr:hypothetical protein [Qipengyuania flava]QYJ07978.1 hypothetical protein KUV82_04530 [Qipengyuania flava]